MSTGKLRFLTLVKPVLCVLPEVAQPDRKIPFKVRPAPRFDARRRVRTGRDGQAQRAPPAAGRFSSYSDPSPPVPGAGAFERSNQEQG